MCPRASAAMVEMGPVEQVLGEPLHPYTKSLKEAIPQADPDKAWDKRATLAELDTDEYTRAGCRFAGRCPAVRDVCRQNVPPDFDHQGRTVKCFLYE
jgi:peptide/nickel transport system ATP-binding protein